MLEDWASAVPLSGVVSCAAASPREPPESAPFGTWLVGLLSVVALLATVSSVFLGVAAWRRRSMPAPPYEPHPTILASLTTIQQQLDRLDHTFASLPGNQTQAPSGDQFAEIVGAFRDLRRVLQERDRELVRLRRGYENHVFRKFLTRFVRVAQAVTYLINQHAETPDDLETLRDLLEDALDECNVKEFRPPLGADYRRAVGVADHPKVIEAARPEDDFRIAEVVEAGYELHGPGKPELLIPAQVVIYRYKI